MDQMMNGRYAFFSDLMLDVNDFYQRGQVTIEQTCPLRQAVKAGNLPMVKELIKRDPYEINKPNNKGWTLLHEAAVEDNLYHIFRYLLSVGAKPDFKIDNGVSPLYVACKYGSLTIAKDLIEAGCEVNCKFVFDYDYGRFVHCNFTALHIACTRRNPDIVRLLIENRADVNAKDDMGRTPIHYAIDNANVAGIRMLIRAGADLLIKDVHGCSPLHYASMLGNIEIFNLMKFLYCDESILNDQTSEGLTSLMLACQFKHYLVAEELIKLGADTTIVDVSGLLAVHMAAHAGFRLFQLVLQNTLEAAMIQHASFRGQTTEKHRSLPCLIIESQNFESLQLLYKSGLSEEILKCPDKINGHLVSPIGFLLLYNSRWFDKEAKLQYLEFLLSYDFLIDPAYEYKDDFIREEHRCQMWVESIEALRKFLPKKINSVEAVVQMHSHLHRDCYCELFLSMILSKIAAPNKYLPCDSMRQLALFNEAASEGFIEALGLLRYAEYVDPDDIMDIFIRQISGIKYNWAGHEEKIINFLLDKCTTNFMPMFLKMKDSLTEPVSPNDRRKNEGLLRIFEVAKSHVHVASLKSMCRLKLRRHLRKEAEKVYESFPNYLKRIHLPPTLYSYLLYNEDF